MIEKIPQSPVPGRCPTRPTTHNPWHSLSFSIFNFQLSIALALGLTLAACHEEPLPADPADNAIPFEMVFSAASRVATDADFRSTWEEGDAIGIFAVKHDPGTVGYLARDGSNYINNARLTRTGGKWVPDPSTELWWSDDGKVLDFYAYYPYSGTATDPMAIAFSASADQNGTTPTRQPAYNASDILAAKATGNGTMGHAKGSTVTLSFRHVLAMVQVTVDPGYPDRSPGAMKNLSVDLLACSPSGTLDLSAGTATTAGNVTRVTMYRPGTPGDGSRDAFTFRALVPPQTIAKGTRPYVVNSGGERFPATVLTDPLELTGGNVTRFGNTLQKRGIRSAADLVAFSEAWNAATSTEEQNTVITAWSDDATPHGTVRLHEDIDMKDVTNFTPIGNNNHPFTGTFDGGGHTISNLSVSITESYTGFFGYNEGTIRGVTLANADISTDTRYSVGGIAGVNNGSITGCTVTGGTIKASDALAGGIAGKNDTTGSITGCTVTDGTIKATNYAGGIAGKNQGSISGCTVTDRTIKATTYYAGGIAGLNDGSITGCTVTDGTITATDYHAGGIAGKNDNGSITGCIAAPKEVSGTTYTGICAGRKNQTITACYGVTIAGMNNVGDGDDSGCTSFDKDKVKETDNFFIAGNPSPIERMNTALQTAGATVRWTAGNADSGWYPVIIEN